MKTWKRFVPITKIDEEKRLVHGVLAESAADKVDESMLYEISKPHFKTWSEGFDKATSGKSKGNLRVMHREKVAGVFTEVGFDDEKEQIPVVAKVVDDDEWKMTLAGGYTGFSIGGKYGKTYERDGILYYEAIPIEGSLVDNPCQYGATFELQRAQGQIEMRKFVGIRKFQFDESHLTKLESDGTLKKDDRPTFVTKVRTITEFANKSASWLKEFVLRHNLLEGDPLVWKVDDAFAAVDRFITKAATAPRGGKKVKKATSKETKLSKMVGENIAYYREEKGLTVEDLAAQVAGLNAEGIMAIEGGEGEPTLEVLQQIAEALMVSVDNLVAPMNGEGGGDGGGDGGGNGGPPMAEMHDEEMHDKVTALTTDTKKLVKAVLAQGKALAKLTTDFDEGVTKTVKSELEKANAELAETVEDIGKRLDKIAKSVAPVGTKVPAEKSLGHKTGGEDDGVDLEEFGRLVDKMARSGHLVGEDLLRVRRMLSTAMIPPRFQPKA